MGNVTSLYNVVTVHTCEIPLQAYIEAVNVHKRASMVTVEDVETVWDASSIAHKIDTR